MSAWTQHGVVPDVIDSPPPATLGLKYECGEVKVGDTLKTAQAHCEPTVSWEADPSAFYTLIHNDPDAPSREDPKWGEWHHWLVTNIPGSAVSSGDTMSAHIGPGPPEKTGLHRYVFLLFKQATGKQEFPGLSKLPFSPDGRPQWKVREFAAKYKLGSPVAGNFFLSEFDEHVPELYRQLGAGKKE